MNRSGKALSVRSKILLAIVVSVIALSALLYAIANAIFLGSYLSIERDAVAQDLRRAADAIGEFSNQQTVKLQDWAQWDDSYNFAKDRDPEFLESAMLATGLQNLDINSMAYLDTAGEVIAMMTIDIPTAEEVDSGSVKEAITAEPKVARHDSLESRTEGMLMLPGGPLIVSSLPLRTTDGGGPSTGTIVFARYLDPEKIGEIGTITHLSIEAFRYDDPALPEDVAAQKEILRAGLQNVVEPVSDTLVRGYTLINDLNGAPALILRVENPRPVYAQGQLVLITYLSLGAFALLLFGLAIVLLLERLVIARFVQLSRDVEKVNTEHDLSIRVARSASDEIGRLADKMNQLLGWLSESREAEARARRETMNLLNEVKQGKEQAVEMEKLLKALHASKEKGGEEK